VSVVERGRGVYYEAREPGTERVRFSSVSLKEAEAFATGTYAREGVICELHEVSHSRRALTS
jgi:hypothetical protein